MLPGNLGRLALEGRYVSSRSALARHSLLAATTAALCGVLYAQFSQHLPASLQITDAKALRQGNPACALAEVPADHIFVSASTWQGGLHSGLVFGRIMTAVKTVRVHVEAGDKPITVFLSGYAVVWDFAGAVDRVRRVVAMSGMMNQMVGVAGIPADRVEIPAYKECPYLKEAMSLENAAVRSKALTVLFGRTPDRDAFQVSAVQLSLPAADFALPTEPAAKVGPARTLTPGDVIAAVPVTKPQTMPGAAGLEQLEADGAIRKPNPEEVKEFLTGASLQYRSKLSPDFLLYAKFDYVITREVTLPQGFSFGPKYLVLTGVPAPHGHERGCLAQMDGFRYNSVLECFPGAHDGVEGLKRMPPASELGGCRLFELPEDAPVHAVAVSGPEQPPLRDFQAVRNAVINGGDKKPYPIDVRVEKPGDSVLVLNTSNPAIWRVSAGPGSKVVAVVLISYDASTVEGLAPGTPVMMTDHDDLAHKPDTAPACQRMRFASSGAYRGGPDATVFDLQVQAMTGRRLESLSGAERLKEIVLR
jgi:hypothetical protein